MLCESCNHRNPGGSRFCNQCGTRLAESGVARAPAKPVRMDVPRGSEGSVVRVRRILYGSSGSAYAALVAVGAIPQPRLEQRLSVPGLGEIVRCFGVLSNGIQDEEATEERTDIEIPLGLMHFSNTDLDRLHAVETGMTQRADRMLRAPDNDRVRRKLDEGRLKYLPVNKLLSKRLESDLVAVGLHLPWSAGGFDTALGSACKTQLSGFGFVCYFGHLGRFELVDGEACFESMRHLSVPFGVDGMHTWDQAISDDIIDEDCGMLIEANAKI